MRKRVVVLGSGNVATHLVQGLMSECDIVQVYSRTLAHAVRLSSRVPGCEAIDSLDALVHDADIYIVCVPDDAIGSIVSRVHDNGALWLHTSGTTPLSVLAYERENCGVLYPMQSFSRELAVDWSGVHIFVEGSDAAALNVVKELAHVLSPHVTECDSAGRRVLHIAAVFSCNFANHLWCIASELLESKGLSFSAMLPLIQNSVDKLRSLTPRQSQTGPATRGDHAVMMRHMQMLEGRNREIYRLLSESIMLSSEINPDSNSESNIELK